MNCERCIDIHKAQAEGKTQESCKCICHAPKPNYGTTSIPFTWTNSTTCDTPLTLNTGNLWTHDCNVTGSPHILPDNVSGCVKCNIQRTD